MYIDLRSNFKNRRTTFFKRSILLLLVMSALIIFSSIIIMVVKSKEKTVTVNDPAVATIAPPKESVPAEPPKKRFIPAPFSLDTIKKKGCVADGMLSEYGDNTKEMIELIERSNCQYLHRALETWLEEPNFEEAADIMAEVNRPGMVYGMFIAESIDKKDEYEDPKTGEVFDFSEMCRGHTKNRWGEHSCIPSFNKEEYRDYIEAMTQKAMDIGIQSFLFGQIHYQDPANVSDSELPGIIKKMRSDAKENNLQIIIGAQTNAITDEKYLQLFDYIEGGVGINSRGNIENGPCWSGKSSCWALLWHEQFRSRAKNVILHLDWSGIQNDDMSKFARMDQKTRLETLSRLHAYFTSRDMGFMMPFLAPLYKDNGGCRGPKKRFYSPDNLYTCKDEDVINKILAGK